MKETTAKDKGAKAKTRSLRDRKDSEKYAAVLRDYGKALEHFQKRHFKEAETALSELRKKYPDEIELKERADVYLKICQDRNRKPRSAGSAEDYYLEGVMRLNEKRYPEAVALLEKALSKDDPAPDRIYYVIACAHAEAGDVGKAVDNLKKAIELNEDDRKFALCSSSFAGIKDHALFQSIAAAPPSKKKRAK
jgi:tetratricopeptide (TPR) repeat protein